MPLPALSKTWEFDVNIAAATSIADETDVDTTLLAIKNALTNNSVFTSPWTVVSSSDGATADNNDNWSDIGDLVHATTTSAHSWIVLEAPVGDQQICFDLNNNSSSPELIRVVWSPVAGFTGGTATARPTASDESEIYNSITAIFQNSTFTSKVHCIISDDGAETRLFVLVGGICNFALITSELADDTGISDTSYFNFQATGNLSEEVLDFASLNIARQRMNDSGTIFSDMKFSGEAVATASTTFVHFGVTYSIANSFNGEFHIGPVGVWGTAGGQQGKIGNLPDVFWGQQVVNTGDQYPATGTLYQFAQIGDLVFPWDSTTVIETS